MAPLTDPFVRSGATDHPVSRGAIRREDPVVRGVVMR